MVGQTEGKGLIERRRHKWEENIKRGLKIDCRRELTGFVWLRMGTSEGL